MSKNYIKPEDSLTDIKHTAFSLLKRAANDTRSAMRFVTMATHETTLINLRTVVFRKFDEESGSALIYTDVRSNKVKELEKNEQVTLLAYDKGHKIQIKLTGKAIIHHKNEKSEAHWKSLNGGKEAYNTTKAPGSAVQTLDRAHAYKNDYDDEYFAVIEVLINKMEVLQLDGTEHIRTLFNLSENKSSWLVP